MMDSRLCLRCMGIMAMPISLTRVPTPKLDIGCSEGELWFTPISCDFLARCSILRRSVMFLLVLEVFFECHRPRRNVKRDWRQVNVMTQIEKMDTWSQKIEL